MEKGTAQLILILIILLFLGSGIYLWQNSKKDKISPTSSYNNYNNSKIYTNKKLGFEFQYQGSSMIKEDSEAEFNKRGNGDFRKNFKGYVGYEPGKFQGAAVILDETKSFDNSPFTVWVFDNPNGLTIDNWFNKYWYYPFLWGVFDWASKGHVTPDQESTVSGQLAKYKIVSYQPGKPKFIYAVKDQKMYLFRIIGEEGDKILATFKFL